MITGIYEFGFFLSKNGRFVTHNFFPKKIGWSLYFYSVFGCAFSGPRCQKRQFLDTLSKKKKILTDNWKALFLVFLCFLLFLSLFWLFGFFFVFFLFSCFFVFLCFVFFGGFKGQARWPKGPPHLALNPPYSFVFVFLLFFFVFFGGFKGQVRWPKGPPHLALNPPYFLFVFFVFVFFFALLSLFFNRQKTCFPP